MELINVEPTRPKWAELANVHGIEILDRSHVAIGFWEAEIELFGQVESELGGELNAMRVMAEWERFEEGRGHE